MKKILTRNYLWFLLVFVISLAVYLFTLCPTIYLEDSAEFVTVAATLGIPHPSGYPLYVLLGKLFTLAVPIGSIAWKVNLMSAFFGALTVSFLFLVIQKILKRWGAKAQKQLSLKAVEQADNRSLKDLLLYYFIPFISCLIFAFSPTFWSQAVIAEVYTLNSFFAVLIIYLLLVWQAMAEKNRERNKDIEGIKTIGQLNGSRHSNQYKNKADRLLLLIIFLLGLSMTNHEMMALLAPIFFIFVLSVNWRVIKDYKLIFAGAFLLFLGLSLYLYLPLRASHNPAYNWGDPQTVQGLKNQIFRQQYHDLKLEGDKLFNKDKLPLAGLFFKDIVVQFTPIGLIIILIGFLVNYFKNKKIFVLLFGAAISNSLLIILLRAGGYSVLNDFFFRVYYLPAYLIMAGWLAFGLWLLIGFILDFTQKLSEAMRWTITLVVTVILFLLPITFLISSWEFNDRSDFWMARDWAKTALESVDQGAYLMMHGDEPAFDSILFTFYYLQAVENIRRDVKLVGLAGIKGIFYNARGEDLIGFGKWDDVERKNNLAKYLWDYVEEVDPGKSVYVFYPLGQVPESDLATRSNGYLYKVYKNIDQAKRDKYNEFPLTSIRNLEYEPLIFNLFYSDLLSDYYLAQASYYLETGYRKLSDSMLLKSIVYDASPFSFNYQAFIEHRSRWLGE